MLAVFCLSTTGTLATGLALGGAVPEPPPSTLGATGLYANGSIEEPGPGIQGFTPQYPLWSDGATKRRWISLPPGTAIDASRPAAWDFPRGVKFWKEFSVEGRRIETRLIERLPDGGWRFASYAWNEEQTEATLAPANRPTSVPLASSRSYTIPSEADCRACHEGAAAPVLGFSALQLSPDRDPLAPHAEPVRDGDLDLRALVADGRLVGLPRELSENPPRIVAPTPAGRAALGYLHANCGQCHVDPQLSGSAVPVELQLALDPADATSAEKVMRTLIESASRYRPKGAADARLVVPGDAAAGTLLARMRSRDPRIQMPPLGSTIADQEAIVLLERWINEDLRENRETAP